MSDFSRPEASGAWPTPKKGRIRGALKTLRAYAWPAGGQFLTTEAENIRLRQVLEQSPQAYAVWSPRGPNVVAPQLARWLGLAAVDKVEDIIYALVPGDAAALEGLYHRLERDGQPFSLRVKTANDLRTLGIQGEARPGAHGETLLIFWFTDLTHSTSNVTRAQSEKTVLEHRLHDFSRRLEAIPLPLWLRDQEGVLSWCNAAYCDMTEATLDQAIEEQRELLGGKASIGKALAARARTAREAVGEKHPLVIKGERRLMQITEVPLESADGGTVQTIGLAQDLTVLDEMQSELRRFRASTQELLRALNTGIAIYNPKMQLTFYNDAFTALFPLEDVFLDDKPTLGEIMEVLREKRRLPEQADFRLYKKQWLDRFTSLIAPHEEMMHLPDGTAIRMLVVPHPLGGLFMTFEDVTSRLELESSYNTLIAVQRETIDNLAEGLAVWRSDARLELYNPAFLNLFRLKPRDLDGGPHANAIIPKMQSLFALGAWDQAQELLQQATISRHQSRGRLELVDGTVIEFATVPLPDGGMLNRFNDVSDTLRVERALREKNAALEQAERLKRDFLANVSYQLRTPLNAMMGFAEVLEKQFFGPMNERQMEYATGMIQSGERLIALINDIVDLSTIDAGYLALQVRPLEILPMAKSIVDLTLDWARKQDITLALHCPPNIGTIEADERRLKQVMLNLINNSIKFTPAGGRIDVTIARDGANVSFAFADTGIGISAEDQQKIFSPFVQLQQNQRHAGAGLGLSLVKSIIELHGGTIHLESELARGTVVTCVIPAKSPVRDQAPDSPAAT